MEDFEARWAQRERKHRQRLRRRRLAIGSLAAAIIALAAAVAIAAGTIGPNAPATGSRASAGGGGAAGNNASATGVPGTLAVPILMYHVINPPPAGAPYPGLYVPRAEFAAQMQALKAHGWHAVTMDQLEAYWTRGVPLGPGRPIVLSFDNGYASQYTNALPVLRRLGWVGVENLQLAGLPPSEGGLTDAQIRGLISAGWELATQGISHADLTTLDASELRYQVATARQELRRAYGVPVNWFCYPSGHYDATVIAAVKAAGFVGSTTVAPGWAQPREDRYTLPRLRVLAGTSPSALLAQIAAARADGPPPAAYGLTAAPVPSPEQRPVVLAVAAVARPRSGALGPRRRRVSRRRARVSRRRPRPSGAVGATASPSRAARRPSHRRARA